MSTSPYSGFPDKSFWSRSVSKDFNAESTVNFEKPLLKNGDKVSSAGSCFASNLIPYIQDAGLEYLRTEKLPNIFSQLGQNLGYANFSAAYGNIYTARQLKQLYQRAIGHFSPLEDRWYSKDHVIDPFRPGLKFPASSDSEFDLITKSHLYLTKKAFEECDVFVFTLGLTEGWISREDGATFPACPGTIAGQFNPKLHEFKNFSLNEIVDDLSWFVETLRTYNPRVRFILSVSPVPLVATATRNHVLLATTYSKSVLRVAAEVIASTFKNVTYFPAYELITGPQAPSEFFEPDKRNVSELGVAFVMNTLIKASNLGTTLDNKIKEKISQSDEIEKFSEKITIAECDEVMLDTNITRPAN